MELRRSSIAIVFATVIAVACTGGDTVMPGAQVADSAGVPILTWDVAASPAPVHRVVGELDLQIGAVDGSPETSFSRIADLAVAGDGSIIVSDAMAPGLRIFDTLGSYRRTLGQTGGGPGEFAGAPSIAGVAGDTVFAYDASRARISTFTLDGRFLDDHVVHGILGRPTAMLRLRDGTFLARTRWIGPGGPISPPHDVRLELDSIVVLHLDGNAEPLDTMLVLPDRNRLRRVEDRGRGIMSMMETITPYGTQAFLRTDGVRPIVAHSEKLDVRFLDPDGGVANGVDVLGAQNPATAEEIRARQEARLRETSGSQPIDPVARRVNLDYLPDRLPAFADLLVADNGDLWIALSEFDLSGGCSWLVFSADGQLRGRVRTPPGLRVFAIGGDHIIGVRTDELDVPWLRRYPLALPGVDAER
jgi:6-bladed beta-propeller